jgi:hypothetical protein
MVFSLHKWRLKTKRRKDLTSTAALEQISRNQKPQGESAPAVHKLKY